MLVWEDLWIQVKPERSQTGKRSWDGSLLDEQRPGKGGGKPTGYSGNIWGRPMFKSKFLPTDYDNVSAQIQKKSKRYYSMLSFLQIPFLNKNAANFSKLSQSQLSTYTYVAGTFASIYQSRVSCWQVKIVSSKSRRSKIEDEWNMFLYLTFYRLWQPAMSMPTLLFQHILFHYQSKGKGPIPRWILAIQTISKSVLVWVFL